MKRSYDEIMAAFTDKEMAYPNAERIDAVGQILLDLIVVLHHNGTLSKKDLGLVFSAYIKQTKNGKLKQIANRREP